jgi:hypothetical protein
MRRLRLAAYLAAETVAWFVALPVAVLLLAGRLLGHGYGDPRVRVRALLRWYPAAWRERHGEDLAATLEDLIADGRDGLGVSFDVARAGLAERVRATAARRVVAGGLVGTGWTMIMPQGVVAAVLSLIGGMPPSWFLALHVHGPARGLVIAGMLAGGALLIGLGLPGLARACRSHPAA